MKTDGFTLRSGNALARGHRRVTAGVRAGPASNATTCRTSREVTRRRARPSDLAFVQCFCLRDLWTCQQSHRENYNGSELNKTLVGHRESWTEEEEVEIVQLPDCTGHHVDVVAIDSPDRRATTNSARRCQAGCRWAGTKTATRLCRPWVSHSR